MVNPQIAQAIEALNYRVTVGDVAAQAGLEINLTQSAVLALASDVGANLQVSESGDIAYLFPRNYRAILRNKYWQLRLQDLWSKVWFVLFYLIRISFGLFLALSIALIFLAIAIIVFTYSNSNDNNRNEDSRVNLSFFSWFDFAWWFNPLGRSHRNSNDSDSMNFLEAIFSVLFGDGNPNGDIEEKQWQTIGQVIREHQGAIVAEQILPYLYLPPSGVDEDFMIPVLSRFNGYPKVTTEGDIIYQFPELQTTAIQRESKSMASILRERLWNFSEANSGQVMLTIGLGAVNLIGALVLQSLLRGGAALQLGGVVAFVGSILWILLAYGIGFLAIPLGRYFWVQFENQKIQARNDRRMNDAIAVESPGSELQQKLQSSQTYRNQVILSQEKLEYTTEKDLLEQAFDE